MPLYKYKVANAAAEISEQLIEADSPDDAVHRLQRRGLKPLKCIGGVNASKDGGRWSPRTWFRKRFDIVDFTDRLAPLLEAHVPLERALGIMANAGLKPESRAVVEALRKGLHEGRRFSDLLRDRSEIFPPLYISLAEVGEEAGALPRMITSLRDFLLQRREMRAYVVSVSIYPCVVFLVSLAVLGVLLGLIVPRFSTVFAVSSGSVQGPVAALLALSEFVRSKWWTLPLVVLGTIGLVDYLRRQSGFRRAWDRFLLKIPGIKRMVLLSNLARMTQTMSLLLRSGVHILDTVKISSRVLQSQPIKESVANVGADLRKGQHLAAALSRSKYIPATMIQMLTIGEETGEVDIMLDKLGSGYERELRNTVQRALSLLEPALILSLGLVVAGIVVSMFMAIVDVQSGF